MTEAEIPQTENYTVEAILGKGGMGVVYLAFDKRLNRKVAIKCIRHNRANENWVEAVTEEARLLAQINHRNIVHIYDLIDWQGSPALVMEYLQGRTLLDIFRSDELMSGELDLATRLDWLRQIAEGLACAHAKGIIHRDLKAENIMITDEGAVKIMDFGIARHQAQPLHANIHDSQVLPGEFIGSPAALSPEQAMGDRLTTASDIFSFGILAYCLLCGHHPFGDPKNADLVLQGIIYRPPMPVQFLECLGVADEDAQALGAEIIACLNKAPGMRPAASALKFDQIIQLPVEQTATPAPPQSSRGLAFAIGAILVTATAGLIWLAGQQPEPRRNIYVAQPSFSGTDMAEYITEATPEFLRNGIIDALLVDDRHAVIQYSNDSKLNDPATLGRASGAEEVLTLAFECYKSRCDGVMRIYSSPNWHLVKSEDYTIDLLNPSDAFHATQWQLTQIKRLKNSTPRKPNQDTTLRYLKSLEKSKETANFSTENLSELAENIEIDPDFIPNYVLLSNYAIKHFHISNNGSHVAGALNILQNNASSLPEKIYLSIMGKLHSAVGDLENTDKALKRLRSIGALKEAQSIELSIALNKGDYDSAIGIYQNLLATAPSDEFHYGIAYCYFAKGNIKAAEKSLLASLNLNSENLAAINLLGGIKLNQAKFAEAIDIYSNVANEKIGPIELNNVGAAYTFLGDFEKASSSYAKALQLAPNNPSTLYNIGEVDFIRGEKESAEYFLNEAIKQTRNQKASGDLARIIKANLLLGELKKAQNLIQAIEGLHTKNIDILYAQAMYYKFTEQYDLLDRKLETLKQLGYPEEWLNLPWFNATCRSNGGINTAENTHCISIKGLSGDK